MPEFNGQICPYCKSMRCASIEYGFREIDEELKRKLDTEKVVLGGCCVTGDDPQWLCLNCGHKWPLSLKYQTKKWKWRHSKWH